MFRCPHPTGSPSETCSIVDASKKQQNEEETSKIEEIKIDQEVGFQILHNNYPANIITRMIIETINGITIAKIANTVFSKSCSSAMSRSLVF